MANVERQGSPVAVFDSPTPHAVRLVHATLAERCQAATGAPRRRQRLEVGDWMRNLHAVA